MIVLSPDAIADIDRMRSFLNNKNPGAAQRAMALILSAIERLQDFPDRGLPTGDGIRQIVIKFGASGYVIPILKLIDRCRPNRGARST